MASRASTARTAPKSSAGAPGKLATPDPLLRHELQVYQEELLVQNEALRLAQSELEATRDDFIELYDFAPLGYLTLDAHGVVLRANLTAAAWLGRSKEALQGLPLVGFIRPADKRRMVDFMQRCRTALRRASFAEEMILQTADGERHVQLLSRPRTGQRGERRFLTAIIDVSEEKRSALDRERLAAERASLTARIISVQEDERRRIARDLHDNVGQQLTGLRLTLEAIGMADGADEKLQAAIARAQELGQRLDQALDFIVAELRPATLDLSLEVAIGEFVTEWSRTFGIAAAFKADDVEQLRISPEAGTHLYRIVQEALNNVYKHSGATTVSVKMTRYDDTLRIVVEDDGNGFNQERTGSRGQLGLLSMKERAELANATIEIRSTVGKSTRVTLRVADAFPEQRRVRRSSRGLRTR